MWSIAFVDEFFVNDARQFTGSLFDGPVRVLDGHILRTRLEQDGAEFGIHVWIAAAVFRGERDVFGKATENLAALGVSGAFFVFDGRPFTMSGHV